MVRKGLFLCVKCSVLRCGAGGGKSTYSVIRIVGNNAGERILVYPNPSRNGAVSVTFNSNEARQIDLVDNTGRVIKQWNAYTAQDLKIDKLSIGVYLLKTKNQRCASQLCRNKFSFRLCPAILQLPKTIHP